MRKILLLSLATLLVAFPAWAEDPGEIQINELIEGPQQHPDAARLLDGRFFVVWQSDFGDATGIAGRLLASDGSPAGSEFELSASGFEPGISRLADGSFIAHWADERDAPAFQRFASDGSPVGNVTEVVDLGDIVNGPRSAAGPNGDFVLTWDCRDGCLSGVFGSDIVTQHFDSTGSPTAQPNLVKSGGPLEPRTASLGDDGFVVVWREREGFDQVRMRRLDLAGEVTGTETIIAELESSATLSYPVAGRDDGQFVVAIGKNYDSIQTDTLVLHRFDSTGSPVGSEIDLPIDANFSLTPTGIALQPDGEIHLVARWLTSAGPSPRSELSYFTFDSQGAPLRELGKINVLTQARPDAANIVVEDDAFLIVWQSNGSLGDDNGSDGFLVPSLSVQGRASLSAIFLDDFEAGDLDRWHLVQD